MPKRMRLVAHIEEDLVAAADELVSRDLLLNSRTQLIRHLFQSIKDELEEDGWRYDPDRAQ